MTYTLVLLRHGESEWNAKNLFTGWVDVDLTEKGRGRGASAAASCCARPACCPTSCTPRCCAARSRTADLALDAADRHWIPVRRSWRLNERHYGALQGKDKKQTLEEYGEEQFMLWRRSYDVPPPPIDDDDEFSQAGDPRYADLGDEMPRTECLKDVVARMLPYWDDRDRRRTCAPAQTVLVAAHGNTLRALVKHLDGISDDDIAGLNIPTGIPLRLRPRRATCARPSPAASTSTPRPPRPPPRPSPTRAADAGPPTRRVRRVRRCLRPSTAVRVSPVTR